MTFTTLPHGRCLATHNGHRCNLDRMPTHTTCLVINDEGMPERHPHPTNRSTT